MTDSILTVEQEDVATTKVVERELVVDAQELPLVIETPVPEVVTLEREIHIVAETQEMSIVVVTPGGGGGGSVGNLGDILAFAAAHG